MNKKKGIPGIWHGYRTTKNCVPTNDEAEVLIKEFTGYSNDVYQFCLESNERDSILMTFEKAKYWILGGAYMPIYFSKIEFKERIGYRNIHSSLLLNIVQKELSYQVYEWKKQMPAIVGTVSYESCGKTVEYSMSRPAKVIRSGTENFEPRLIPDEQYTQKTAFSYGIKLSEEQIQKLLPYCDALEFEPYRNREMSMNDEGYIGYRDEISLHFTGITDSCIPKMEWDMRYYYDEEHIWPSEKLYRYLVLEYLQDNKKLKGWGPNFTG